MKSLAVLIGVALTCWLGCAAPEAPEEMMMPPPSVQLEVRESWLETRHGLLLDMMRRHEIDMWIVVNEEFHDDPLTEFVAPPEVYVGNRDVFVFIDDGDAGLRRVAITGYAGEHLKRFFESPDEPRPAKEVPFALLAPQYEIAYLPSATTYTILAEQKGPKGKRVLALGDPDYGVTTAARQRSAFR